MSQTEIDSLKKVTLYEQNDTIRANNYEYISWLYYRVNTDSSLKYAQKSYYLAKGLEDRILQSIALKHMGRSHSLKGNYNIAMNCYLESLELDEEFGTTMMIAESLMGMATVSGWLKLHKQAAGYNLQCLDLISSLDSTEIRNNLQLAVYNNLGYDHMGLNAYETANSYFKKVLSFSRAIGVDYYIPAAYRNLGEVYVKGFDQPDSALLYYDLAISLANQRNDIRVLTESYLESRLFSWKKVVIPVEKPCWIQLHIIILSLVPLRSI